MAALGAGEGGVLGPPEQVGHAAGVLHRPISLPDELVVRVRHLHPVGALSVRSCKSHTSHQGALGEY